MEIIPPNCLVLYISKLSYTILIPIDLTLTKSPLQFLSREHATWSGKKKFLLSNN